MKVLVLGCGPAGLMAAQGAWDAFNAGPVIPDGAAISIMGWKVKSDIHGCQYLHKPIPSVTPDSPRSVSYQLRGDSDDYRRKVYGPLWSGTVSPEDLTAEHQAWDLRETYDRLWNKWEHAITDATIDPHVLRGIGEVTAPDLVINSIPRPSLCHAGHAFGATEIWAAGDAPALGIRLQFQCPDGMVICNAEDSPAWYRMSRVFGHTTVEWPGSIAHVPVTTAARVAKPTAHSCDCWAGAPLTHVGRYGRWEKGVLSHTAYFDAYKMIDQMIGGSSATAEAGAQVP